MKKELKPEKMAKSKQGLKEGKQLKYNKKLKPVQIGSTYEFDIINMGYNGEGVARLESFAIFIDGVLTGEKVKAEVTEVRSSFARAKLIDVISPSEERVEPKCKTYEECGGCQLQHMKYEAQLEYKTQHVFEQINRIECLKNIEVLPCIGMQDPFYYRNKAQFPVAIADKCVLGFYKGGSHEIVPIDNCIIQHRVTEKINKVIKEYIDENHITVYDEAKGEGTIRHILTKIGFTTGEVMVVIITNGEELRNNEQLIEKLVSNINENEAVNEKTINEKEINKNKIKLKSVVQNINSIKNNKILGSKSKVLWGEAYIEDYIGNLKFRISAESFYQVNPVQTEVLYNKALEYAALTGSETVIDAYCGIGTISLFLAQKAKKVYGIEIAPQAIKDAKINASINNMTNTEFLVGKSEEIMPEILNTLNENTVDVIVMDPPRKGCEKEFLDAAVKMNPKRMVYVSCNPSTLARDLEYLHGLGYAADKIQPVDMFPETKHVECVCLLSSKINGLEL
jgi:23S rRNA (uracil1939-C5)-methyltransferase